MNMNNDKMFACVQCIFKTIRKGDLTKHVKRVHLKIKNMKCKQHL